MTLTHLTDDLLFEIVGGLKIEDIIRLGAASGRLRSVTTNEKRVWVPRLLTTECGLGIGGLDAAACATLARLECDPRKLCLQSLPWRPACDASGELRSYAWRPRDVLPSSLCLKQSRDFIFCEAYVVEVPEDGIFGIEDVVRTACKVVPLYDCDLSSYPEEAIVPLGIPGDWPLAEPDGDDSEQIFTNVRLFAVVDGSLYPIGDMWNMELDEDGDAAWENLNSRLCEERDAIIADLTQRVFMDIDEDGGVLESVTFNKSETLEREHVVVGEQFDDSLNNVICPEDTYHGRGLDGFRSYLRHGSVYAQRGRSFVSDYRRADPSYYDADLPYGVGAVGWTRDDRRDATDAAFVALDAMRQLGVPEPDPLIEFRRWGPWLVTDAYRN